MHTGQRGHGARGAEQVRAFACHALAQAVLGLERPKHGRSVDHHCLEHRLVDEPAAVALRERDHAHGQRRPRCDAILHFQAVDVLGSKLAFVPLEVEPDQFR